MPIGGDPIRSDAGHRLARPKECPGSSEVTMLAQPDVHQSAVAIDRAIEIPPSATHPDIRLINLPAWANPAFASPTQVLGKCRRQLCLPIAHRFIAEGEPPGQEHLGQIPQAQLVTQPPEHHECDDIARILRTVEHTGAALVELLAAGPAPVPAVALRCPLRPLADSRRSTCRALHCFQSPQRAERADTSDGAKADGSCATRTPASVL
jgi:hypothetical protein